MTVITAAGTAWNRSAERGSGTDRTDPGSRTVLGRGASFCRVAASVATPVSGR